MSAVAYTDQQQRALDERRGAVTVDAGAGCGKTFVLTERFLSHLDPAWPADTPARLDELVAITFTDAAAREMRSRIREKCRERLLSASGEGIAFWRGLLRSLDSARVSTIHSFASRLIRDHAVELGIDPSFAVLDPAEAAVLKSAAVDDALRARLTDRDAEAVEDLIATAAEFDLSGLRERVRAIAERADDPSFKRWKKATPEELIDAWRRYYVENVASSYAEQLLADPRVEELRELLTVATPVKPGFADRIADLADAFAAIPEAPDPDDALRRLRPLLNLKDPERGSFVCGVKDWPDKESKERFSALLGGLRTVLDRQRRAGDRESMRRAAELGLQVQHLAATAAKNYGEAKRERGVLDNDDLLVQAHRLLTHPALADARERIAGKVRVLLVDEFQDTDPLQAELVRAILGEPSAGDGRALFVVGDFKQSIYRFRGAAPEVFQELRDATPGPGRLALSQNFRSQPAVLDFVNTLFGGVFGDRYQDLTPSRPQVGPRPAVEMLWTPPPEDSKMPAQRAAEAATIAARIRGLVDGGEPIVYAKDPDRARPARPGDFALLFRALSDVAAYEHALRETGLEYYLVGGHAFYAQQEVFDVLNLLRAVLSECDDIALAGVLRSPMFGLADETLFWLAQRGGLSAGLFAPTPPRELDAAAAATVAHARDTLKSLRRLKDRVGAAELLRTAWDATGYDATLVAEFLGERKLANLDKLCEQARQADATGSGLRGLAARLTEFVDNPPKEALAATTAGDADVVRLMTVHASKGLEFPIVVLPDLNRRTQPDKTQAVFDPRLGPLVRPTPRHDDDDQKGPPIGLDFWRATERPAEEAERDRLFYVACTRAADRLILSACRDDETKLEGPWLRRLAERFDLASGVLLDGGDGAEPLVTVTPPPAPVSAATSERRSLHAALEALDSGAAKPAAEPAGVAAIPVVPDDLVTFSVSRLSGKLHRDAGGPGADEADRDVDARRLGTLVHAVIERLDPHADDAAAAIRRWCDLLAPQHARRGVAATADAARRLVARFVETPEWRAMRNAVRLEREAEFLLRWPPNNDATATPAVVRGYLDALYQDATGAWHVVDYKTNAVDAKGVPRLAEQYALQMAVYAHAIEAATGAPPASLTLVFLAAGVSHRVAWDEAARSESTRRITTAIQEARQSAAESPE